MIVKFRVSSSEFQNFRATETLKGEEGDDPKTLQDDCPKVSNTHVHLLPAGWLWTGWRCHEQDV